MNILNFSHFIKYIHEQDTDFLNLLIFIIIITTTKCTINIKLQLQTFPWFEIECRQ